MMSGWYELSQSSDGQYRFVLKAGNGEVILTSELYKARASAQNGLVKKFHCSSNARTDLQNFPS